MSLNLLYVKGTPKSTIQTQISNDHCCVFSKFQKQCILFNFKSSQIQNFKTSKQTTFQMYMLFEISIVQCSVFSDVSKCHLKQKNTQQNTTHIQLFFKHENTTQL